MKAKDYDRLVSVINSHRGDDCTARLLQTFPHVDGAQLTCIYGQEQQRRVKKSYYHYSQTSKMIRIYDKYLAAVARGEGPGILIDMARYYNFSSAMLAKLILEQFLSLQPQDSSLGVSSLADTTVDRISPHSLSFIKDSIRSEQREEEDSQQECSLETEGASERNGVSKGSKIDNLNSGDYSSTRLITPVLETGEAVGNSDVTNDATQDGDQEDNSLNNITGSNAYTAVTAVTSRKDPPFTSAPVLSRKSQLNKMYRDTALIPDKVLSFEVHMCLLDDEVYGPFADTIKHSVGHEYEVLLCRKLEEMAIGYQTEDDLRLQGCDKTPDIKLDVPIGVGGRVVNWIESKASFGDRDNHKTYLKDQFWSYWNRFGPGLVIYWFGFIEELDTLGEKGIFLRDAFPTDIVKLDPLACLGTTDKPNNDSSVPA